MSPDQSHNHNHNHNHQASAPAAGEFIDTQVVNGLFLPTDMAFLPDGRMLVIEKEGAIKIIEDPTAPNSTIQTYMDLSSSVLDSEERGLLSIEVDPDFENNGYFYLFYTNDVEDKTTVSRFQHIENTGGAFSRGNLTSERVLWQEHDVTSSCCHQGGGLAIAYEPSSNNDPSPYKIYITVGEEFEGANAQDLGHDDGKVHRINLTDGSIPVDNPYYEASTAASYTPQVDTFSALSSSGIIQTIYAYGLRNPFRASYDQGSQTLFIGEVGGNNNNTSREDIHITAPGVDHGWPSFEGFFGSADDPGNPIHSYPHLNGPGQGEVPAFGANGASVTGGVVYRGDDFPEEYEGAYFYGDWVRNWIRYLEIDYSGDRPVLIEDHAFKNTTGQVLSFEEGPDGSLYYLTTFQTGNVFTFQGAVNRLNWSQDNSAPTGSGIILDPGESQSITAPHTVTFETDAIDPDGDELSFQWSFGDGTDLDGDGVGDTATSTEANPTYAYTEKGEYIVELVVTDDNGAATVFDSKTIVVGQKPEVTITTPLDGGLFKAGDILTFTGSATDPEDGALSGDSVVWSAVFLHNEHTHPGITGVANQVGGVTFEIDASGHDYSSNTGYEIFLTATDSDGISTTESVIIRPEKVNITFDAPINTYTFLLDGVAYSGDYIHDTAVNFQHTVEAQERYVVGGFEYLFSHWEDDPTSTNPVRDFVVQSTDTTFRPVYVQGDAVNQALLLDGSAGVSAPNIVVGQDNGNFTVEAWVKFNNNNIDNRDGIVAAGTISNGNDINFYDRKIRLYSALDGDVVVANYQSQVNVWTHYVIAREDGVMKVYINGQLDKSQNTSWTGTFVIDQIGNGLASGGLNGEIDELRIWSVARSASDIDSTKGVNLSGAESGLERYYAFDGGFIDVTANSQPVTLSDNAQLIDSTIPISSSNISPVAVDDAVTIEVNSSYHIHILDNDFDPDGNLNPQVVEVLTGPNHGSLEIIDTQAELDARGLPTSHFGHAEYTPNNGFTGIDTFTYRVQDDQGAWSNPATATITVEDEPPLPPTNQALSLDGTGGIDVEDITLVGDFTIETWVKFAAGDTITNQDGIVSSGVFGDGNDLNFYKGKARIYSSGYSFGNDPVIASQDAQPEQWGHYAFVRKNGIAQVYINGILSATSSQLWNSNFTIDQIGTGIPSGGLKGELDEFRIWSVARTQAELEAYKARNLNPATPGLERYYQFETGVVDVTNNSSDATLSDVAQLVESTAPIDINTSDPLNPPLPPTRALSLDGTGGIEVEDLTLVGDFTIETWIKFTAGDAITNQDGIVSGGVLGNGNDLNFYQGRARIYSSGYSFGTDPVIALQNAQPEQWGHYAFVRKNGVAQVYINGTLSATSSQPWNSDFTIDQIGAGIASGGLNGELDEFRIWSVARTQTEIETYKGRNLNPATVGLERYYQFETGVVDITGNSSDATLPDGAQLVESTAPVEINLPANQALFLDGTGGIDVEDITLVGDFTIETWVQFTAGDTITNQDGIVFGGVLGNGNDLNFYDGKARIYSSGYDFGTDPVIAPEGSQPGQWGHYAFVRENGVAQIYIDGTLSATSSQLWNSDFTIDQIGAGIAQGGLNGKLDELRIWSVARTQADLAAHKDVLISGATAGLERYYQFDGDLIDATGNSNEAPLPSYAQLVGSTAFVGT
ncbi:MAG: LamG-like jellyroll fold domain-containing protein [Cyanobacteria bacterium J06634_6]